MSTSIPDRLVDDLRIAMRSGDSERRDAIRLLRSAVKNREIEVGRSLEPDEAIEVVQAQIKQRRDSIDAFSNAGRYDLAAKEQRELEIFLDYLPADLQPIDESQLKRIVAEKVDELGLEGPADMRILMPALIEATAGRADNRLISRLASDALRQRAAESSG